MFKIEKKCVQNSAFTASLSKDLALGDKEHANFVIKNVVSLFLLFTLFTIKNCQVPVKNLNFVAGMTRRFVSAKRLVRYFSTSSKLVEHRAQSPVRERC